MCPESCVRRASEDKIWDGRNIEYYDVRQPTRIDNDADARRLASGAFDAHAVRTQTHSAAAADVLGRPALQRAELPVLIETLNRYGVSSSLRCLSDGFRSSGYELER
ncbi:hypothetical protein EYF80_045850 [Liparis tanakae]|uniref:Uncharacterized protein n=1 Tax=Liparis tanakae TaxID=230148 RepID=A0A4Z2FSQ4_9TELE|nr:hypothetical protein EYF80_045850 [Liparis tanakae]